MSPRLPAHGRSILTAVLIVVLCGVAVAAPLPTQAQAAETASTNVGLLETATPPPAPAPIPDEKAAEAPIPGPAPGPAPSPAPSITSPPAGGFIGSSTTAVGGMRGVDQEIQFFVPNRADPVCIVPADGTTAWECTAVGLPSGPDIVLRAVVTGSPELSAQQSVAVLGAPTVVGGPSGQAASNGMVRGMGYGGASVTATLSDGPSCQATADSSGAWACFLPGTLRSGTFAVTASQMTNFSSPSSSNASPGVRILFDLDRPAPPVLTAPTDGATVPLGGTAYNGRGENGATVTVFAGPYSVCTAVVGGGAWACTAGGVAAGRYNVIAVQQDAAGNVGGGSPAISVDYGSAAPATPTPSPSASGAVPPESAAPDASETPEEPSASAAPPKDGAAPPPSSAPTTPDRGNTESAPPWQWNDPTQFATAVTSPWASADFPWLQALVLALGAVLLLALPSRLLAGTISRSRDGRPFWGARGIAGRNRIRHEFEEAPTVRLNRWLLSGAALVAAATFVMLSGPVIDQPAYLRLLVAVTIALVIVNAAAILVPLWWSSRLLHIAATSTFLPRYLLLVGVAAIGSRILDIHPALLFGLLGSVAVVAGPTPARRGQLAAVRAGTLTALGVLAWIVVAVLPTADTFLSSLIAEVANTVVLGAIGSAVFVLIPIGSTSGRSILAWSPPIWAALTVPAFTIMFAVLTPQIETWNSAGTVPLLWVAASAFAALSAAVWAWQRFVAPAQR